jgi:hypothetical protein
MSIDDNNAPTASILRKRVFKVIIQHWRIIWRRFGNVCGIFILLLEIILVAPLIIAVEIFFLVTIVPFTFVASLISKKIALFFAYY